MQDFVKQAEALINDAELRQTVIANGKAYVETKHSAKVESEIYSMLATAMCRSCTKKSEDVVSEKADDHHHHHHQDQERKARVRFQFEDKKSKDDTSPEDSAELSPDSASDSGCVETPTNEAVENETPDAELKDNTSTSAQSISESNSSVTFNVILGDVEEESPESSQIFSKQDSTTEKVEKHPVKFADVEDDATEKTGSVDQSSVKARFSTDTAAISATPAARSPRAATIKTEARKRVTAVPSPPSPSTKNTLPTAAGRSGGTAGKNGHKQAAVSAVSDGTKKTTTATSKKVPLNSTHSLEKATLKQPSLHRSATRTASDTDVSSRPASRSQKRKK